MEAKTHGGRAFDPSATIGMSILSIITGIVAGSRYPYGHPTLVVLKKIVHDRIYAKVSTQINFFPLLRFLFRGRMNALIATTRLLLKTLEEVV